MATAEPALSSHVNWDSWTPGSIPAARQAKQLDQLIASAVGRDASWSGRAAERGSLLASIEDTRLDRLSNAVADAVARGDSVDTLARTLQGVLDDPQWAEMVATTEMNRAMSAATMETYRQSGVIDAVGWMTSVDDRVCLSCSENEGAGLIPLGSDFPSGDPQPPIHPLDRCALYPGMQSLSDVGGVGALSNLEAGEEADLEEEAAVEAETAAESTGTEPLTNVEQHDTAGQIQQIPHHADSEATQAIPRRSAPAQDDATMQITRPPAQPSTVINRPLTSAEQAQLAAQRRAEREAAGATPAPPPRAQDVTRQSEDDLAARIAELPAGVADLRLGPDAGLGRFRVRRRSKRKAAGLGDGQDDELEE